MESKKQNLLFKIFVFLFLLIVVVTITLSIQLFFDNSKQTSNKDTASDNRRYHIIVTGTYENRQFMEQVYNGAALYSDMYNAIVELHVPLSQAEDVPLQVLLDYASFVSADGVIAYNDSSEPAIEVPNNIHNEPIPLITTGQYDPNVQQISYIGTGYWEIGKKLCDEATNYLHGRGNVLILSSGNSSNLPFSNILNSLQDGFKTHPAIKTSLLETTLTEEYLHNTNLIITLSEEDSIRTAQILMEYNQPDAYRKGIIGFGSNETCQLYLDKGVVSELITVDPVKIGQIALKEMFEYKSKGYANSYISADVKVLHGSR